MKTASKLFTVLFFSFALASTTGCSIVKEYTSPQSSTATEAKKTDKKTGKTAAKKTATKPVKKGKKKSGKKAEEEDGITVYKMGGYAIKAALVYALIVAFSS